MKPAISEFSFGYAVTESIVRHHKAIISGAPIFPSLREEGRSGGGYDLQLNRSTVPLFLQFKLSHRMIRKSCFERKVHRLFSGPFFRIHLMPLKLSLQHNYLLLLDNGINEVYYVAPFFTNQTDLNRFYTTNTVLSNSAFIKPSTIGPLPDKNEHHIAFQGTGLQYLFSKEPKILDTQKFSNVLSDIEIKLKRPEEQTIDLLRRLEVQLKTIIGESKQGNSILNDDKLMKNLSPLDSVTFLARYFFGCEFFLVTK
jgi:hypothetical protein